MHRRDLKLGLRGNTKTTTITCVETVRNPQHSWNPPPVTFVFKDEGGLATHPPSCHPQRVFGCLENERKWEKVRENEKRRESLKLPAKIKLLLMEKFPLTVLVWGFYSQTPLQITKKLQI